MKPPTPKPCESCPYRRDVPSGIWDAAEYAKLPRYDADTASQPTGVFQCHQNSSDDGRARACGGWAHTHGEDALALRLAVITGGTPGGMTPEDATATMNYQTTVDLFDTGAQAAEHGMRDIDNPNDEAIALMDKIANTRGFT